MRAIEKSETVRSHSFFERGQGQPYLNRRLSMFEALIRVSRVDGGIRSFAPIVLAFAPRLTLTRETG
jgi:hypothetical protein